MSAPLFDPPPADVPTSAKTPDRLTVVESRVEDILDHIYGKNVRPPVTVRDPDEMAAETRQSNLDD